ncbi:adenylyl-sulfate kinase [Pedobacter sp. PLR]|uniref:adenylyl-sulfate kinase n=1 Tax=Pedobacter sp. PLR TaxID=2994465 RepID=UPI002247C31F|nr:adenylyl-sulfate kinase [Pedobacter sp. PLR]MCX2452640.1 adenylyl-sulfate kinase [Pedobacter sp. PLR]
MGVIIPFCGLSGSGKTTLAVAVASKMREEGLKVLVMDGDYYRQSLCKDLGFSKADRLENVRRIREEAVSRSADYDLILMALINPFEKGRTIAGDAEKLVWIKCSLETLRERDTKGLYFKAYLPDGHPDKIYNLTGVNDTFEIPEQAGLVIETDVMTLEESLDSLYGFLRKKVGRGGERFDEKRGRNYSMAGKF